MGDARIDGRPVALEAAIAEAARMLAASRLPVIAGLGTDIAGARAAVALARRIGGVVDHMHAAAVMRDLAVMRQAGAYLTTPNEARLRGDTLLLVGPGLIEAWPDLRRLFGKLARTGSRRGASAAFSGSARARAVTDRRDHDGGPQGRRAADAARDIARAHCRAPGRQDRRSRSPRLQPRCKPRVSASRCGRRRASMR